MNDSRRPMTRSLSRRQLMQLDDTKPYNKIITSESPKNIVSILARSQITGKSPKNLTTVSA